MTKDEAFAKLVRSKFRSRFKLAADDLAYIERVGLETIRPAHRRAEGEGRRFTDGMGCVENAFGYSHLSIIEAVKVTEEVCF